MATDVVLLATSITPVATLMAWSAVISAPVFDELADDLHPMLECEQFTGSWV